MYEKLNSLHIDRKIINTESVATRKIRCAKQHFAKCVEFYWEPVW